MVVTLKSQRGQPRRHDIGNSYFYVLSRDDPSDPALDVKDPKEEKTSSWHAAVLRDQQGGVFLVDLESKTGTYMDGKKLEPHQPYRWKPGCTAVLGIPKLHDKATLEVIGVDKSPVKAQKRHCEASNDEPAAKKQNTSSSGKCDKCDGPHATEACPHFKKARENHKDAWANYGKPWKVGSEGGQKFIMHRGKEVRQPGDGSCLFHSLCFGLNGGRQGGRFRAAQLRKDLANFIGRNPQKEIAGDTLEEWVRWDARSSVSAYAGRMARGGWGGGIEMAACCLSQRVNVHVYVRRRNGFERISCFDYPERTKQTIHVLYQGGVHYDALVPC